VQHTPNPVGATFAALPAVSCVTLTECTAAGTYTSSTSCTAAGWVYGSTTPLSVNALVESWNGKKWTIVATPIPTTGGTWLQGLSCLPSATCTAVGYANYTGTNLTLAEASAGTGWSIQSTPNPPGSFVTPVLSGVSCPSANMRMAVGRWLEGSTESTLAELYS
jgi:hypothetical protein